MMNKFIIKNCDCKSFCHCKSVSPKDCVFKRIAVICNHYTDKSNNMTGQSIFLQHKIRGKEELAELILKQFEIEEIKE